MSLALTPEQEDLVAALRGFLDAEVESRRTREVMETRDGVDLELWRRMNTELGLGGALVAEEHGGTGLGLPELALIMECAGRTPVGVPLLSTTLAAVTLSTVADPGPAAEPLRALASGRSITAPALSAGDVRAEPTKTGWTLHGTAEFVLDGHVADLLLVAARTPDGNALFAADPATPGVTRRRLGMIDLTRPMSTVVFDAAEARALCAPDAQPRIARLLDVAAIALAAEQVGGAARCLELSVAHARTREQFGRPIGSFQAIKHMCADMLRAIEPARSAVYFAARAAADDSPEAPMLASLVKAHCSEVYADAAGATVQIHGGLGYSWEHDAHLHFKRAKTGELLFGDPARHRARLTDLAGL
ncbi:acyl-CoA dehydrogenase family protein [Saccharopolyspora shandongensis]|uniref:acyl-CoA dehydrogenase family protein n=1 Tax=Saccharopolyspora shandongensis TaxID=418495 RepID=UPI0033DEAAD5